MSLPILEARGITKRFGHVQALVDADISVFTGEVVALIGDNGAGKSTLTKILSGALRPDTGEIRIDGAVTEIQSPIDARRHGIETVYQDLALALDLDPVQNVFLGREIPAPGLLGRFGFLDRPEMRRRTEDAFGSLGVQVPALSATFIAAFLDAYLRALPLHSCLEAGRDAAAETCTHLGGFPQNSLSWV